MLITSELIQNLEAAEATLNTIYTEGYNCGYEWLAKNLSNFRHPYDHGYIPGGPWVCCQAETFQQEYRAQSNYAHKYRMTWINGWIDGINKYVRDNNLPFDQIPNER